MNERTEIKGMVKMMGSEARQPQILIATTGIKKCANSLKTNDRALL